MKFDAGGSMYYILIAAGAAGVFSGLRFNALAMAVFSALIFLAVIPISLLADWSIWQSILMVFAFLAVFQAGYLAGLFWRFAAPRVAGSFHQLRETDDRGILKDTVHVLTALFYGHHHPAKLAGMGGSVKPEDDGAHR
jgi:hypothetical protein